MASESEGITALFSMYKDDDDEDEDEGPDLPYGDSSSAAAAAAAVAPGEPKPPSPSAAAAAASSPPLENSSPSPNPNPTPSPYLSDDSSDHKTLATPIPPARSPSHTPQRPAAAVSRGGVLGIVDYAHDEMVMSPEQEEGEIVRGGRGGELGWEVRVVAEENLKERTVSGTAHILMPKTQPESSQPSDAPEPNQLETDVAMDVTGTEMEVSQVEENGDISVSVQNDDPLSCFLPPPVTTKCSPELQLKINKFLAYKKSGKSFNAEVRNRKDYRNPDFLQHAVRYQEIDQIGTCFSKDVFDPYGYERSDYYDEIEADMKRELERKDLERKKSQKVEFVGGGIQPGIIAPVLKTSTQNPAAVTAAAMSGLPPVPAVAEGAPKETRQNKKTKWDKIDGDVKNPAVSAGHDNLSAISMHAALLTAANAGAGYTAFAQQKKKEAEEKRTSNKKSDRRS